MLINFFKTKKLSSSFDEQMNLGKWNSDSDLFSNDFYSNNNGGGVSNTFFNSGNEKSKFSSNFSSFSPPTKISNFDFPSTSTKNNKIFEKQQEKEKQKQKQQEEDFLKKQRNRTRSEPANVYYSSNIKKPCNLCGKESIFECNFCANLIKKGINLEKIFFCSDCMKQGWKNHHGTHEKLSVEYKIFL